MAADPELAKASNNALQTLLPYLIIIAIMVGISNAFDAPKRRSRKRRNKHGAEMPAVIIGFAAIGYLIYRGSPGLFWFFAILAIIGFILYLLYRNRSNNRYFAEQDSLEKLRSLTPNQFEEYIAKLFQRLGYSTEKIGGSYDGGIDVIAEKDGIKEYIQCKKFITRQVSVHDVRDFFGAIAEKLPNARGIFITTNVFTPEARRFCEGKPIELIDDQRLMEYVRQVGVMSIPESQSEACPRDGGKLVERQGKFGPFLGCSNYPRCTYTKTI